MTKAVMDSLSLGAAREHLCRIVEEKLDSEDLLEVYNTVFEENYTEEEADDDPFQIVEQLVDYIDRDLDPVGLLDVWDLISPRDTPARYDAVENLFRYDVPEHTVLISGHAYPYIGRWDGRRLMPDDGYLALDTETEVVDLKCQIPRLALASASAGPDCSCLIHPDDVGKFILAHEHLHIISHNSAFDFWAIEQHLRERGEEDALQAWWDIAEHGRLHDSMLLDMLVRLARDDSYPAPRDLATVAAQYTGLEISKTDPYRIRYGEIIDTDWDDVDEGFFAYAVKDAIVTRPAYRELQQQALTLADGFGQDGRDILPGASQEFGVLTEAIQVKKAIALAQISRNGMAVDLDWVRRTEGELRAELLRAVTAAQAIYPVYRVDATGNFVLSGSTDTPGFYDRSMREHLTLIKEDIERETGDMLKIPATKTGISRSTKAWADYAHLHPFLEHWIRAQNLATLLQFFGAFQDRVDVQELAGALEVDAAGLARALKATAGGRVAVTSLGKLTTAQNRKLRALGLEPAQVLASARALAEVSRPPVYVVHPSYTTMVCTGRTSCSSPNVQQVPRDGAFRQAFMASPGHYLLAVDYSFVELCTLAATTLARYGRSDMAEVIKAGIDPHAHTAAMMLGVRLDEFATWKDNEAVAETGVENRKEPVVKLKDMYDRARQMAKPINFGVPGGLGVASLVSYAHATYKVDFTLEQAKQLRELLTSEIYKELDLYLAEDGAAIVAKNLDAPLEQVRHELGDTHLASIFKILAGDPRRVSDGKPYEPTFVSRIWASLALLNRNPDLQEALENRQASRELAAKICHAGVATLTGRIRGRVRYSQARNTPFQGLAADGAGLALFALVKEGFRVVGFVHDEVLVELPDEGGYVSEAKVGRVEEIMRDAMGEVLVGGIPVGCEAALSERWHKKAKLYVRGGKVYPWRPAQPG